MHVSKSAVTALAVAAAVTGSVLSSAAPAQAATWRCTKSQGSIDDPTYSGPMDNWNFTVSVCAMRVGTHMRTYADFKWNRPVLRTVDDSGIFNTAYVELKLKRSTSGPDPLVTRGTYDAIEGRLENSSANANYDGRYRTPTITRPVGSSRGLGDAALWLDWNNDGKPYRRYDFTASPVV